MAVGESKLNDSVLVGATCARCTHTVADAVAEVDVGAEAGGIGLAVLRRAAEVGSLTEHIVDANLL